MFKETQEKYRQIKMDNKSLIKDLGITIPYYWRSSDCAYCKLEDDFNIYSIRCDAITNKITLDITDLQDITIGELHEMSCCFGDQKEQKKLYEDKVNEMKKIFFGR